MELRGDCRGSGCGEQRWLLVPVRRVWNSWGILSEQALLPGVLGLHQLNPREFTGFWFLQGFGESPLKHRELHWWSEAQFVSRQNKRGPHYHHYCVLQINAAFLRELNLSLFFLMDMSVSSTWVFFSLPNIHIKNICYSLIKNKILTSLWHFFPSLIKFVCWTLLTNIDPPRTQSIFLEIYPTQITI